MCKCPCEEDDETPEEKVFNERIFFLSCFVDEMYDYYWEICRPKIKSFFREWFMKSFPEIPLSDLVYTHSTFRMMGE